MFNLCPQCGIYDPCKVIEKKDGNAFAICPNCNYGHMFNMLPLFILIGASGTGKSTICLNLAGRDLPVVPIESDILWRNEFDTPDTGYREYRELWLRLCKNIALGGKPVLLCGCGEPSQYEECIERRYFKALHYLTLICDEDILVRRLKGRPSWRSTSGKEFMEAHVEYNRWLKENADKTTPPITVLDTSSSLVEETVEQVKEWLNRNSNKDL